MEDLIKQVRELSSQYWISEAAPDSSVQAQALMLWDDMAEALLEQDRQLQIARGALEFYARIEADGTADFALRDIEAMFKFMEEK